MEWFTVDRRTQKKKAKTSWAFGGGSVCSLSCSSPEKRDVQLSLL